MKQKKAKAVAYRFIAPDSVEGRSLYERLQRILVNYHEEIADARFALAWNLQWKPDVDGHVTLGQCRRVGELDREIVDRYDFVIVLNQKWWQEPAIADLQRDALLDHECCHAAVKHDSKGEPCVDERGRVVYRLRHHEIEDFTEIADRYGCWKKDLEAFARALDRARHTAEAAWVGYSALHAELREAGLTLPLEAIVAWTDAERREARTWALLRHESFPQLWRDAMPAFLVGPVPAIG